MEPPDRSQPRALADILASGPALGALKAAADLRVSLADAVRESLEGELRAQVLACNLREDGTLTVTAASAAWATRLRFEAERMLAGCRPLFPQASRVRVRVATET